MVLGPLSKLARGGNSREVDQTTGSAGSGSAMRWLVGSPDGARRRPPVELGLYEELEVDYDEQERVVWCSFRFAGRPSFTPTLLRDIFSVQRMLQDKFTWIDADPPVRYLVWASRQPGIFNLGGDLELFATLIRRRDRESLWRYASAVIEGVFQNWQNLQLPLITVSLVQGDALGGGFEGALSGNIIIAERSAKFGLPEILFGLFPGMGAYTFLARRIAPALAERMIMSGEIYTAEKLHEMGIVDVLAEDGRGVDAFHDYIGRNGRRHAAHRAIYKARQIVNPVRLEEMLEIGRLWVDTAMQLEEADLKRMERLAAAQDRRRQRTASV